MKVIRCECGCIYPDDMDTCPTCKLPTKNINNRILSETSDFGTHPVKPFVWSDDLGKSGTYKCLKCGMVYSKKLIRCPDCGSANERKLGLVRDLERKVCQNPSIGLKCKKCGTLFPNDMGKCPYCSTSSDSAVKLSSMSGTVTIVTPITQHYKWDGYTLKFGNSAHRAETNPSLTICKACGQQISTQAESCPHCGHPTGVHICPKCGSANTKTISGASKATSIFLWGPFAANKVLSKFQCKDCGHKF